MCRTRSIQCDCPRRPGDDIGVARESFRGAGGTTSRSRARWDSAGRSGEVLSDDGDEFVFRAKARACEYRRVGVGLVGVSTYRTSNAA